MISQSTPPLSQTCQTGVRCQRWGNGAREAWPPPQRPRSSRIASCLRHEVNHIQTYADTHTRTQKWDCLNPAEPPRCLPSSPGAPNTALRARHGQASAFLPGSPIPGPPRLTGDRHRALQHARLSPAWGPSNAATPPSALAVHSPTLAWPSASAPLTL